MTKKTSFEDACILNVVRALRFFAWLSPLGLAVSVGRFFGLIAYGLSKRRAIARRNLRAVFAERLEPKAIRALARRSFQNLGASFGEMLKIPDMGPEYLRKHVSVRGHELFNQHAAKGNGALLLTAHFGSWELLNIAAGLLGLPLTVLARIQKHPRSDEFLNKLRASKGSAVVFKGMMLRQLIRALQKGGAVGMLIDQDGGRKGTFVHLFGRRSSTPSGAAQFALTNAAPVFCAFIRRVKSLDHEINIEGPLEIPPKEWPEERQHVFLLQQFTDRLEKSIRRDPDQWLWAHRRWKSTPDRWVVVLSDGKPGHAKQSEAVVRSLRQTHEAAGRPADSFHLQVIECSWKSKRRLSILKAFGFLTGRTPEFLLKWALESECAKKLFSSYADVIISCGSSLVDAHLWLKRENAARSLVVMKPYRALDQFETVLVPEHDQIAPRSNIFETRGALTLVDPSNIKEKALELSRELGLDPARRIFCVYLGGDAGAFQYEKTPLETFLNWIVQTAEYFNAQLIVTTSRRTPEWAEEMAREILGASSTLKLLVNARTGNRPGLVEAMTGLGWAHWISGESVSMVSEVLAAHRPTMIFFPGKRSALKKKHSLFLERLIQAGSISEWRGGADSDQSQLAQSLTKVSQEPLVMALGEQIPEEALQRIVV